MIEIPDDFECNDGAGDVWSKCIFSAKPVKVYECRSTILNERYYELRVGRQVITLVPEYVPIMQQALDVMKEKR